MIARLRYQSLFFFFFPFCAPPLKAPEPNRCVAHGEAPSLSRRQAGSRGEKPSPTDGAPPRRAIPAAPHHGKSAFETRDDRLRRRDEGREGAPDQMTKVSSFFSPKHVTVVTLARRTCQAYTRGNLEAESTSSTYCSYSTDYNSSNYSYY